MPVIDYYNCERQKYWLEQISFCTYAEKDDIQPTALTPWIGFVYTFPNIGGNATIYREEDLWGIPK